MGEDSSWPLRGICLALGLLCASLAQAQDGPLCADGWTRPLAASIAGPRARIDERSQAPFLWVPPGAAQGQDDAGDPPLLLPLRATRADVSIAGVIAQVKLSQTYVNDGDESVDAVYVFPASTRAAVNAMKMRIGERVIQAQIKKRREARADYERARRQGNTASLLEQQRPNVFEMSVANIQPGDTVKVELFYSELLVPEERVYELVIPTVVGPRYVSDDTGDPAPGRSRWTANPHLSEGEPAPFSFGASVAIGSPLPIAKIWSSHDVEVRYDDARHAQIELPADVAQGESDLVLRYRLAGDAIESGLLLYPGEDENFFLLMVEPPAVVERKELPPREYIFILDVSGSMSGFPLDTSKRLLRRLLDDLRPQDRFNVLLFAGDNALLSLRSLPATAANKRRAQRLHDIQRGGGGTEILPAIERALALPRDAARARVVVIATDGYVTVEPQVFATIAGSLGEASLFTFGIGRGVNRHLIEGMARAGQGQAFVVLDEAEAESQARRFARYVRSPLLHGLGLQLDGVEAYDIEPAVLPDLFAERPIIVSGKYRGEADGRFVLRGMQGEQSYLAEIELGDGLAHEDNAALAQLWARRRVQRLNDLRAPGGGDDSERRITALGLRYHLLTAFTSFVAVDSERRGEVAGGRPLRQVLPLPAGVSGHSLGALPTLSTTGKGGSGRGVGYGSGRGVLSKIGGQGRVVLGGRGRGVSPMGAAKTVVTGGLDRGVIRRVIQGRSVPLRSCYERELRKDPQLAGRVLLVLVVGSDGRVKSARVLTSSLNSKAVESCLLKRLSSLTFPRQVGGQESVIHYPLVFAPGA